MATVKAFIRPTSRKGNKTEVPVRFRLSDGANVQLYHTSDIMVDPEVWDAKKECIKAKVLYHRIKRINFANSVMDRKELMLGIYSKLSKKKNITSEEFGILIDQALHPENYHIEEEEEEKDFFDYYTSFLDIKEYEPSDRKNFDTMGRLLKRFELFVSLKTRKDFKLVFEELNVDTIRELDYYIRHEHLFVSDPDYQVIFEEIPEKRRPQLRGRNTVIKIMKRFRTFIKWAMKEQLLQNDPFVGFELKSPQYGTPYYITVEERTKIAETDLHAAWKALPKEQRNTIRESMIPQLEIQRDIFIFHCMIGCRVGDLVQFTWKNVINDHISYIARKTSKECVESIEVPLNNTAKAILSKYKDILCDDRLLPFISPQKYNDCIKMIFLLCGLTRNVTIWNSTTGREEQHPLNELASSHLARRTFIGNLYKKVQDPNMIGKLSGHVEGSRAFARYRTIDDDMKKSLVSMLE